MYIYKNIINFIIYVNALNYVDIRSKIYVQRYKRNYVDMPNYVDISEIKDWL